MNESRESTPEQIAELENYLVPGEQTRPPEDEQWQKLAESIEHSGVEGAIECAAALRARLKFVDQPEEKWRRDAAAIWASGYYTGCTDLALVTAALAREKKIPTKVFTTVDLQNESSTASGHTAMAVYEDNDWWVVDPSDWRVFGATGEESTEEGHWLSLKERVRLRDFERRVSKFAVIGEGKDLWDMGIKSGREWQQKADQARKKS